MNEIILALAALIFCGVIVRLLFGKDPNEVEYMPMPPKSGEIRLTTDIFITKNTKWLTEKEFFGNTRRNRDG